jgi:hypothetical protein
MLEALEHAKNVRARLRNPPNAVPDLGIDLKRIEAQPIAAALAPEPPRQVVILEELRRMTEQVNLLRQELRKLGVVSINTEDILNAVCDFFPVSVMDIKSDRRQANVVRPRMIAMWLTKQHTQQSLPQIGKRFGGRDHTTVLHAVRRIDGLVRTDPDVSALIKKIEAHLFA